MTRAVLFDLDDTLFDHRGSARAALTAVHASFAADVDFRAFEQQHAHYLEEMHLEVLAGRVTLDDARRERFRRVFAALGVRLDPADVHRVAAAYRDGYAGTREAMAGAIELLAHLRSLVPIAVVTNNLLDEQRDKLNVCGLAPYVDVLIASEDVGVSKPHRGIFDIALQRLAVTGADAVMVGDSWPNDIAGAVGAGIRAIWFNPEGHPQPPSPEGIVALERLTPPEAAAAVILSHVSRD
jgi:HAD superfamily hydrolase (TIGR01549 family)